MVQEEHSQLDAKQQNLTVLLVQVATAKEELEELNQQARTYETLASLRSGVCNIRHESGHMLPDLMSILAKSKMNIQNIKQKQMNVNAKSKHFKV